MALHAWSATGPRPITGHVHLFQVMLNQTHTQRGTSQRSSQVRQNRKFVIQIVVIFKTTFFSNSQEDVSRGW